jgi:hypothetical protein
MVALLASSFLVALLFIMETTLRLWQNGIQPFFVIFWLFLQSFFWTFFPCDQFLDQLIIHNCSPIDRLSMIYSGYHHGKLTAKTLHLVFLIYIKKNSSNLYWHTLTSYSLQPTLHWCCKYLGLYQLCMPMLLWHLTSLLCLHVFLMYGRLKKPLPNIDVCL